MHAAGTLAGSIQTGDWFGIEYADDFRFRGDEHAANGVIGSRYEGGSVERRLFKRKCTYFCEVFSKGRVFSCANHSVVFVNRFFSSHLLEDLLLHRGLQAKDIHGAN